MSKPPNSSPSSDTPVAQKLRKNLSKMSTQRFSGNWQKGITPAALALAQQES